MERTLFLKLLTAGGILLVTVISGLLPLRLSLHNMESRQKILSFFTFFTGGVFLGAGAIHMLPDAVEQAGDQNYPWVFLTMSLGFVVVWSVDKIEMGASKEDSAKVVAIASSAQERGGASICYVTVKPVTTYGDDGNSSNTSNANHGCKTAHENPEECKADMEAIRDPIHGICAGSSTHSSSKSRKSSLSSTPTLPKSHKHQQLKQDPDPAVYGSFVDSEAQTRTSIKTNRTKDYIADAHATKDLGYQTLRGELDHEFQLPPCRHSIHDHEHQDIHHHHLMVNPEGSFFLPLMLACLFSVHSFIAGLALGVQSSFGSNAVSITIAILSHKTVEAIAVTSEFIKENVKIRRAIPVVLVYCIMTPLGIVFGACLTHWMQGDSAVMIQSEFGAFAAGSFLFLTTHEISDARCCQHVSNTMQVLLLLAGLGVMAVLAIWV